MREAINGNAQRRVGRILLHGQNDSVSRRDPDERRSTHLHFLNRYGNFL
jgi:hypothetical protein